MLNAPGGLKHPQPRHEFNALGKQQLAPLDQDWTAQAVPQALADFLEVP